MTDTFKKYTYWTALGLFAYMPFHIFISQWLSTFTGGLDAWKVAKDIITAALVAVLVCYVLFTKKYTKLYLWLVGIAIVYLALHLLLFAATHQPRETGFLATTYNNRLIWYALIGYSLSLINPGVVLGRTFSKVLIAVAVLVSLVAFAQWLLPKDVMTHFGYSVARGVKPNFFIDDKPDLPRVFSTLRDPNSLGAFLVLPTTFVIIGLVKYWNTSKRMLLLGLELMLGLTVFLTFSRSAWIGVFIAHGLAVTYLFRQQLKDLVRKFIVPIILGFILVCVGVFFLRNQYVVQNVVFHSDENTKQMDSNNLHVQYVEKGLHGMIDKPQGHGPGTAGIVSTKLPNGLLTENYYVQIGYEVGVLGLVIFLGFLVLVVRQLWRGRSHHINQALLASFIGLAFMNLLLHTWSNEAVAASWFMLAGLALRPTDQEYVVGDRRAKVTRRRT